MADINKVFVDDFYNDLLEVKLPIQHLERLFHRQDVKLSGMQNPKRMPSWNGKLSTFGLLR